MVTPEEARELADSIINGWHERKHQKAYCALIDLAAQVEALQTDAERYRWLKSRPFGWSIEYQTEGWATCYGVNELDAAIDEARKQS